MVDRSALGGALRKLFICALSLALAACAEFGDAWQKTRQDVEAMFDAPPHNPGEDQQRQAKAAYERALKARATGDSQAAAGHFRNAAQLGNAEAAYELGIAYIEGDGVPENKELSADWINRAADLGHPGAQFLVGASFYGGIGVAQDVPYGLDFLERAAAQGHPKAQFLLGQAYVDGVGVAENAEWAARWYGKAARGGNPQAQYALGVMFASGLGVPASARCAYEWFSIAAANGYQKAAALRDETAKRLTPAARAKADATIARFSAKATTGYVDAPTVLYVQLRLRALGYDVGPADGIAGPRTQAAIEAFQSRQNLAVDGKLTRELVEDLFSPDPPRGP